jgi:hypothetical protein
LFLRSKEQASPAKQGIKGAKAAETAADVSKLVSQTKHVFRYDKIMPVLQAVYHQVVKATITQTIRSFKQQLDNFLKNVGSVLMGPKPAVVGVGGSTSRMWMSGAEREAKGTMMNIVGKNRDEVVGKSTGKTVNDLIHDPKLKNLMQDAKLIKKTKVERRYMIKLVDIIKL